MANGSALVAGELSLKLPPFLEFSRDEGDSGKVSVAVKDPEHAFQRAMWGMCYSSKFWWETKDGLIISFNVQEPREHSYKIASLACRKAIFVF